jgi:hypothetical protein
MKHGGNRVQGKQDGETFVTASGGDFASAAEGKASVSDTQIREQKKVCALVGQNFQN